MTKFEEMDNVEILNSLANGVNPETGEILKDEIFQNPKVFAALYEAVVFLKKKKMKSQKANFIFTPKMCESVQKILPFTTIQPFAQNIAIAIDNIISYATIQNRIQNYLIAEGLLVQRPDPNDGDAIRKFATDKGNEIGISDEYYKDVNGIEKHGVRYSEQAQDYILSKLPEILN